MNQTLELLIAKENVEDRWEYDEKPFYDTEALEAAYREEMYTEKGREIIEAAPTYKRT